MHQPFPPQLEGPGQVTFFSIVCREYVFIGKTKNYHMMCRQYMRALRNHRFGNPRMEALYDQYGVNGFTFTPLETLDAKEAQRLNKLQFYKIEAAKTHTLLNADQKNPTPKQREALEAKRTPEYKRQEAERMKKAWDSLSEEARAARVAEISERNKARWSSLSEEARAAKSAEIKERNKMRPVSDETKRRMSASGKGKHSREKMPNELAKMSENAKRIMRKRALPRTTPQVFQPGDLVAFYKNREHLHGIVAEYIGSIPRAGKKYRVVQRPGDEREFSYEVYEKYLFEDE